MLIKIDDVVLRELTEEEKRILYHDMVPADLDYEIARRIIWVIDEKLKGSRQRILAEYLPILKAINDLLPTDEDVLVTMILALPEYKDRQAREDALNTN